MSGMGQSWLTRPGWLNRLAGGPRAARVAGVTLALAAVGQAIGQSVALGSAQPGQGLGPGLLTFLYAFPLGALALLATVPPLLLRPAGAAVLSAGANVLVLALFPAPTVAGAVAAVLATARLGATGELRTVAGRAAGPAAAQYLAVGLAVPFLALALARPGNLACLLLAVAVPTAAGAGIAVRSGRAARTYSEAGEALADTLVAHTARGERARIARELHDVVAHHISMIAVQAETGRLTTPGLPEAGAQRAGGPGRRAGRAVPRPRAGAGGPGSPTGCGAGRDERIRPVGRGRRHPGADGAAGGGDPDRGGGRAGAGGARADRDP